MKYFIITFASVAYAMQFEKTMNKNNIPVKLIPVPRTISASCGMCGRMNVENKEQVLNVCKENNVQYENIYDNY